MGRKQARRGGETGTNGEFYEGGKFLPSTDRPKRTPPPRSSGPRKEQVEPFKYEVPPAEGLRSLFAWVAGTAARFDWETRTLVPAASDQTLAYLRTSAREVEEICDRFNSGERWFQPR